MDDDDLTSFLSAFRVLSDAAGQLPARDQPSDPLVPRLSAHLGADPRTLPTITEPIAGLRVTDADVALEVVMARHGGGELIGIGGGDQRWHQSLSEIIQQARWMDLGVGAVEYRTMAVGPDSERSAVALGVRLFAIDGVPVVVLQRVANPQFGAEARIEVMAPEPETAASLLAEVREAMAEFSVLRGQVVTFEANPYGATSSGVTFLPRPEVGAADVVLPGGLLARAEAHVLGIGRQRDVLLASGQHLKRGVLLYGPPGTGKTLTVRYLVGRCDLTVIMLSGQGLALVGLAAQTARALAPAIVVLEDCDLVAEERSMHSTSPLLFEVLDALDGLAADADVAFLLTTNRVDVLEPALAQRPGRVDLALEIPLPDEAARRALLALYAPGEVFSAAALDVAAARTEGTTASFAREVMRRSVLRAAEADEVLEDGHLTAVLDELLSDAQAVTRAMLGGRSAEPDRGARIVPASDPGARPAGFGWSSSVAGSPTFRG